MSGQALLTASQIRQYYAEAIRETEDHQLNYLTFYEWLRARGLRPKGNGRKEQQRSVYNAVTEHKDFVKVAPGVFALADPALPGHHRPARPASRTKRPSPRPRHLPEGRGGTRCGPHRLTANAARGEAG